MGRIVRLTERDLTRLVRRVISEQNSPSQNEFKSYGNQKLIPLGFEGESSHNNNVYSFKLKEGTRSTYKEIVILIETDNSPAFLNTYIITGAGRFSKDIRNVNINQIKTAVDEVIYLNNLINSAVKISDVDRRLLKLNEINKTIIGKGFEDADVY
jgi:hypothetical protein